nr:hypothetical protein [Tanacetum cinerariifolium]
MTGHISYLSDYEPYDGGYVSFGQGGCKITGKETIKTGKIEFENMYFVKDLKTLRQHNMYSINLNNVVLYKDLTCLVAKASADECMLWHRRLGHLNFKTMNRVKIIKCDNGGKFRNKEMNDFCSRKGIKRELYNARTPQQNGIAKKRNKTLIEAARTMLADAKLPVTFWTETVNTACYVQNRVLVNKYQNKTPYKLFNGRTPAIGFLKPFGCHVMILNTLDNLGKFEAKGDKGYFIGYSMSSKAFRILNKRTKRVEENLHVDFLENKPIEKGDGPNWLFDIDSLTNSMNYVPVVVAGTNSTNFLGTKEAAGQDVKKDVSFLRYIALPNWFYEAYLESTTSNAQDACNADAPESSVNSNPTATSTNPLADHMETLAVETLVPTVSSHVSTACLNDSPEHSSDTRLISKRVTSQDDMPSLDNILTLTNRFEDILRVTTNTDDTNRVEADLGNMKDNISASPTPTLRIHKDHPKSQIINHMDTTVQTRTKSKEMEEQSFIAIIHQKTNPALLQFCLFFWVRPIGTKWVLKNKKDERRIVIRNKVRLVAQGDTQEERIDYDEVFAPVARIEAIRLFLAYASFMGFTDLKFLARVYKVDKAMYGLHQAPRAWYGTLSKYLLTNGFQRGTIDQTLFIIRHRGDFLLVQVYVDDIILGSLNLQLCREFEALMHKKFQMSAMGKLNLFLDVRSSNTPMDKENPWGKDGTRKDVDLHLYRSMIGSLMYLTTSRLDIMFSVCACARHQVTPKECHLHAVKRIFRYLKGHPKLGLWYHKESPFDLVAYLDSDYGGATQDRKSTTGGCQFLGRRLISWQCKKQTIVATSTTEAEYVATASGCGQVLWIQNQLLDYGYALILNPTIYVSHIQQFWSTARIETTNEGTKILATVDELFENLTLMGYNILPNQKLSFQKGHFSHQWKYLIYTIMQCLSPKSTGFNEFSSNIATALVCLANNRVYNFLKMIFDGMVRNVNNKVSKFWLYPRRARIAQFSALLTAADEPASPIRNDNQGKACPTVSGLEAEQDRANITKTSTFPNDSTPRDLEIATLNYRIKHLEDRDGGGDDPSREDATIKGRRLEAGEEAGIERSTEKGSDDTEEMVPTVSVPPATISVPTGSSVVPTNSPIFTTITEYEQFAAELPIERRIELISDLVKYQDHYAKVLKYQTQQRKPLSKKQQREFYISVLRSHAGWKTRNFKGMTLEEIKEKFDPVWKQIEDFIPIGSKEEGERFKRKELRLEQDNAKKVKTSKEVSKEDLKDMMQLVPVEEVYVEAL